jgi:Tol biopolymer transport system component
VTTVRREPTVRVRRFAAASVAALVSASVLAVSGRAVAATSPGSGSSGTAAGVLAYVSDSNYYGSGAKETLATVLPDGSGERVLLRPAAVSLGLLAFSSEARRIAYFRGTSSFAGIEVMDVATRKVVTLFQLRTTSAYVDGIAWTPSGDLIVSTNEQPGSTTIHSETALWRIPVTGGKAKRLTPFEDAGNPAVAPDGQIVYVVSKTYSSTSLKKAALWTCGPNGSTAHRLFESRHFVDTPSVSPDGRSVTFSVVEGDTTAHLVSLTVASGSTSNLTPLVKGRTDIDPTWSPDGSRIVFLSSRAGRYATTRSDQLLDAYVMAATGRSPRKAIGFRGDKRSVLVVAWGA